MVSDLLHCQHIYGEFDGSNCVKARYTKDGVIVSVHVHPSARNDGIDTTDGIVIHTRQPPRGNKANTAVIAMLSRALGIPRGNIAIVRGASSRNKEVHIRGLSPEGLDHLLGLKKPR